MNMLANYLPDEDVSPLFFQLHHSADGQDPTYPSLYAELPEYLAGVHARYPPVCTNCQPAVDEALRKANHRANVDAWGSALRRGHDETTSSRGSEVLDVLVWRMRGVLFGTSAALSLGMGLCSMSPPSLNLMGADGQVSSVLIH
jgi:hypothetical protein